MRVLLVHSYYRLRGGEDVVFDSEVELLRTRGHEVWTYQKLNDDLSSGGSLGNARNTLWNRRVAREIAAMVRRHQIEVVHFHNTFPAISGSAIPAARHAGAATVQTLHNFRLLCAKAVCFRDDAPCQKCVTQPFALSAIQHGCFHDSSLASAVIAASNYLHRHRRTYQKHLDLAIAPTRYVRDRFELSGYPIAPIVVKPHFVEVDSPPGDGWGGYALFVGRLSEEKGLRTLLKAWDQLPQPIELRIIGDGPLASLLTDRGIAKSDSPVTGVLSGSASVGGISWMGQRSQAEVYEAMSGATMLVLPSQCAESFGRVVVEAFARGTPVLCSNVGGQSELVDSTTGGTFVTGDIASLTRAIDQLCNRPDLREGMRSAARKTYEMAYTADENHDQLIQIYELAIAKRHGRSRPVLAETPATAVEKTPATQESVVRQNSMGQEMVALAVSRTVDLA